MRYKRIISVLLLTVIIGLSTSYTVFADINSTYPGGGMTMYQTPMCIIIGSPDTPPTPSNGSNPFYGYYCLNQYTSSVPVSGTYVTSSPYTHNSTQWYYRFKAAPGGTVAYTSCGYAPSGAPELSINRNRVLPSTVNMITTVGNSMSDFNIHPGSCFPAEDYGPCTRFVVLAHTGTYYPCPWTLLCYENGTMGPNLKWVSGEEPYNNYNITGQGTPVFFFLAAGYSIGYCICGMQIA